MNLNQTTIKKHLEDIHADITKYLPQIITYRAEVKQAEATYTPEYAEQSKKRSFEKLAAAAQNTRDSIQRHIESICAAAVELEHQPFVEEVSPTLALISTAKGKLPLEIKQSLIQPFIGNKQALVTLQAAFEANDADLPRFDDNGDILSRYIFDAEKVCSDLSDTVYNAFIKPESSALPALGLWKYFANFAELEGVELSVNFDDDPNAVKFKKEQLWNAAGLELK